MFGMQWGLCTSCLLEPGVRFPRYSLTHESSHAWEVATPVASPGTAVRPDREIAKQLRERLARHMCVRHCSKGELLWREAEVMPRTVFQELLAADPTLAPDFRALGCSQERPHDPENLPELEMLKKAGGGMGARARTSLAR